MGHDGQPLATDGVVALRRAGEEDGELLERLSAPAEAGPFNSFDEPDDDRLSLRDVGGGLLIVTAAGVAVGDVTYFGVPYGPTRRSLAWRIGITVLRAHRGLGYGARAQRLLADLLLATTPSNRIEADVDPHNTAERRSLEKAGFRLEGTLTGAQHRAGRWHDVLLYSRTG